MYCTQHDIFVYEQNTQIIYYGKMIGKTAVKHQQIYFLFTQNMITGAHYPFLKTYFCAVPYTILCNDLFTIVLDL